MSLPFDLRPVAQQLRSRYAVAVHVDPRSAVRRRTTSRRAERTSRQRRGYGHRRSSSASDSTGDTHCCCMGTAILWQTGLSRHL